MRHSSDPAKVPMGGRMISVRKPRVRSVDGATEVGLETWVALASRDLLSEHTVACRRAAMPRARTRRRHALRGDTSSEREEDVHDDDDGHTELSLNFSVGRSSLVSARRISRSTLAGCRGRRSSKFAVGARVAGRGEVSGRGGWCRFRGRCALGGARTGP